MKINNFILLTMLFLLFPLNSVAEEPPYVTVNADGIAMIAGNNMAMARNQAINDALRKAVEEAVGSMVSAEMISLKFQLLDDQVYSKPQGYIQNYKVISEKPTGNLYQLTVQATVATDILKDDLSALGFLFTRKNMPKIIIMVAEQNIGQESFSYWWGAQEGQAGLTVTENALMENLIERGFNVIDHSAVGDKADIDNAYRLENITKEAIKIIGNLYDAEVVIYGKALSRPVDRAMNSPTVSAEAEISLRAINTKNGEIIASVLVQGSAMHINDVTAGAEALRRTMDSLSEDLIIQIVDGWSKEASVVTTIKMAISGIKSYTNFIRFKDILQKDVRSVKVVHHRSSGPGVATLDIEIKGSAQELADELTMISYEGFAIDITDITPESVDIKMRAP